VLPDRSVFTTRHEVVVNRTGKDVAVKEVVEEEQLFVNYCFQPKNSTMLLFPYGQGVNLINHAAGRRSSNGDIRFGNLNSFLKGGEADAGDRNAMNEPNVYLRWSEHQMHHSTWLDFKDVNEFWKHAKPGGLILEVVALRGISAGEELFVDYGAEWEEAWREHVDAWKPPPPASSASDGGGGDYKYPAEMDETAPLRTIKEQLDGDPYPSNLITTCVTPDWSHRHYETGRNISWYEPEEGGSPWWQLTTYCHILERIPAPNGDYLYTVQLLWKNDDLELRPELLQVGSDHPRRAMRRYIDHGVPRRAIRFVERPYKDDEHLPNAFRHPISFPDELVPEIWRNVGGGGIARTDEK